MGKNKKVDRAYMMLEEPIAKAILRLAYPTIIAMLVDSIYNLADTFFVSSLGEAATAAVAVNDSFMHILFSIGAGFAFGAGSYVSRLLGAKEGKHANEVASSSLLCSVLTACVFVLIIFPNRRWIVDVLGSTQDAMKYAVDYATWITLAMPFTVSNNMLNQLLKGEGNSKHAMAGQVSGCVLNCILDPIFIFVFKWEVAGAAAATALSKVLSFCVLLTPYIKRNTTVELSFKNIHVNGADAKEVAKVGIPVFFRSSLMSVGSIVTNRAAKVFGTTALAAISIANKVYKFVASAIMGFANGYAPLAGYCWGAKKYSRVKEAFLTACKMGVLACIVLGAVMFTFATPMVNLFNKTMNPEITAIATFKLRFLSIGYPFHMLVMITNHLYQALGRTKENLVLGMSRQLLFLIPLVLILPIFFKVYGVASAQAVADILSGSVLAIPLGIRFLKKIDKCTDGEENTMYS